MSSKVTNEAPQQEAMEVDGDGEQVELKQEPEDATMNGDEKVNGEDKGNGDEKVNGEDKGTSKSGIFKIKVSGLPRFYPLGVSKVEVIIGLLI
jgi:hypothetical protein